MIKEKFKFRFALLDSLLSSQSELLLGADISSSSVKMVELSSVGKLYRIERYAIEPLPADAVVDGNLANLEAVTEALKRGWKRMGARVKNLALALPSTAVITKKIIVPAGLREDELEMQVETEANQHIPFPLDEVNLDFQVLGPLAGHNEDIEVLIAASRKEKVEDRIAVVEGAGLKAVVMDVEQFATQTAFELIDVHLPNQGKDQLIAVVDIGAAMTTINVIRNRQSVYLREQPFGGNALTHDIRQHFGLSADEAEAAKRNGGLPQNYESDVLRPFMESVATEVARALQFFFTSTQFTQVHHLFLAGGCAAIPGLDVLVAEHTQIRTGIANPFANMALSSKIRPRHLASDAPSLVVACGLAMRRFDS